MPFSQAQLRQYSPLGQSYSLQARAAGQRVAFLCHSHKDEALALGLQALLRGSGFHLYIDWQDAEMPSPPSAETAARIRVRIRQCNLLLFLATQNSMNSRWCPWELGFADGAKRNDEILIIPTTEAGVNYGAEYVNLYRRIDTNAFGAAQVFSPGQSFGVDLRNL